MGISVKQFKPLSGQSKYHLVFLHGMNSNPESLENLALRLQEQIQDTYISLPTGIFAENEDYENFRWFNKDLEKSEMLKEVESSREEITSYIGYIARQEEIPLSKVILCGFSQGAMMALYIGPRLKQRIFVVISFSGNIIFSKSLDSEIKTSPDVLLLHGTEDKVIPYTYLAATNNFLQKYCAVTTYTSEATAHTISNDMLEEVATFIKKQLQIKH